MKLGSLAGGTCRICGSDTYGSDIGCGCKVMYNQAKFMVLKNHAPDSLEYNYSINMRYIMDKFVSMYESKLNKHNGNTDKMYRNNFKKQFFPSVYDFYKNKGYVSKKQLSLVMQELYRDYSTNNDYQEIEKLKANYLNNFVKEHDTEIIDVARNLWKSKKEK